MKHLKSYKIFENIDDTIKYFQDILLELSDENFNIRVKENDLLFSFPQMVRIILITQLN